MDLGDRIRSLSDKSKARLMPTIHLTGSLVEAVVKLEREEGRIHGGYNAPRKADDEGSLYGS